MATGKCLDCKHWKTMAQMDEELDDISIMRLLGPRERDQFRICELTLFNSDDKCLGLATARDASGYLAGLFTRAEFGCVQFED